MVFQLRTYIPSGRIFQAVDNGVPVPLHNLLIHVHHPLKRGQRYLASRSTNLLELSSQREPLGVSQHEPRCISNVVVPALKEPAQDVDAKYSQATLSFDGHDS